MARQDLPVQFPTSNGMAPAYVAAHADGHSFSNDGHVIVIVKVGITPTNLTIQTPGVFDGNPVADKVVALPADSERHFTFKPGVYNRPQGQTDADRVWIDFSSQATVTLTAIHHP